MPQNRHEDAKSVLRDSALYGKSCLASLLRLEPTVCAASPVYPPRVPREGRRDITRWLKLLSVAILFSGATTVQRWAETRLVSRGGGQMILENGGVLGGGAERT